MVYLEAIYPLPRFLGNPKPGNCKGASLPALPYQVHLDDLAGDETMAIQQGELIEGLLGEDGQTNTEITVIMEYSWFDCMSIAVHLTSSSGL